MTQNKMNQKITLKEISPLSEEFNALAELLNAELAVRDGEETAFYSQFNGSHLLSGGVIAYMDEKAVGIAGFKERSSDTAELKRMYVLPEYRGSGLAKDVLHFIEQVVHEKGFQSLVLETGLRQPEAIAFYTKNGYTSIENFEPYVGVENSRCFRKTLDIRQKRL